MFGGNGICGLLTFQHQAQLLCGRSTAGICFVSVPIIGASLTLAPARSHNSDARGLTVLTLDSLAWAAVFVALAACTTVVTLPPYMAAQGLQLGVSDLCRVR